MAHPVIQRGEHSGGGLGFKCCRQADDDLIDPYREGGPEEPKPKGSGRRISLAVSDRSRLSNSSKHSSVNTSTGSFGLEVSAA